jgi:N-acetylmuramoyl-L-alanine amidase CwlA
MTIINMPCNPANYGGFRAQSVRYIVIHFTAGKNDTAKNNGTYFAREAVGASAHFFVDETTVVNSVPEDRVAYHCGGYTYYHPECRNGNSIGVEICTKWENGQYAFAPETVANAQELVRELMEKYDVPIENVIRHYDVTEKNCPAPFVGAGKGEWLIFKEALKVKRYNKVEELPDWAVATIQKLVDNGILQGNGEGLDLSHDMVRMLVILDRAGMLK